MQVILGSGGAIGNNLAKELKKYTSGIRLVSRHPKKVNEDDELFVADLMNKDQVEKAVEGAEVVYLTVGLTYRTKIWEEHWPLIMENTIAACKKQNAKLVFFDNVYMYNPDELNPMTEETEIKPSSKKGLVRAQLVKMIMNEVNIGNLKALIARSADFYGPGIDNSVLNETVVKNLKAGKKANWFCSTKYKHSYTYTPDAAKATALLGNTESAFQQVWHLPTAKPLTGKQWIEAFAKEIKVQPKTMVAPKFMIQLMGIFNPIMKEFVEMLYQYDRDYDFVSAKFENTFQLKATPIEEAVREVVNSN